MILEILAGYALIQCTTLLVRLIDAAMSFTTFHRRTRANRA